MQPYFFPYVGYFQLMAAVDTLVILDDVSFINRGWINRNRIAVSGQALFFTVPLEAASQNKRINEIKIAGDQRWCKKLLRTLEQTYGKSIGFETCFPVIQEIVEFESPLLSEYLLHSLQLLQSLLMIDTHLELSSKKYGNTHLKAEVRIIDICLQEAASTYINLEGGINLYNKAHFESRGIDLQFLEASQTGYTQGKHAFIPSLSILDVLMCNTLLQTRAIVQTVALS